MLKKKMKKYAVIGISGNSWAVIYHSLEKAENQYKTQEEINEETNDDEKIYLCEVLKESGKKRNNKKLVLE